MHDEPEYQIHSKKGFYDLKECGVDLGDDSDSDIFAADAKPSLL